MGQLKASDKDVVHEQQGNIVVVNTCGFIDNAKEESVNTILSFAEQKQMGKIDKLFVTGCLSERYKDDLEAEIPDVDDYFRHDRLTSITQSLRSRLSPRIVRRTPNYHSKKLCLSQNIRRLRPTLFVLCHSTYARRSPFKTH
jgi:tRNA A37 methylthiotransferase MiaB